MEIFVKGCLRNHVFEQNLEDRILLTDILQLNPHRFGLVLEYNQNVLLVRHRSYLVGKVDLAKSKTLQVVVSETEVAHLVVESFI